MSYLTVLHEAFTLAGNPVAFEISLTYDNRVSFSLAPLSTISISSMISYSLESFPKASINGILSALNDRDRFDRFTCGNNISAFRVLFAISTGCNIVRPQVYEIMCLSSILATEGVPSSTRLASCLSIYAFLSMKPGKENPLLLPGEG